MTKWEGGTRQRESLILAWGQVLRTIQPGGNGTASPLTRWPKFPNPGMIVHRSSGNPPLPSRTITEPARQIPLYGESEVAVLGGGPAGSPRARGGGPAGRRARLTARAGFVGGTGP